MLALKLFRNTNISLCSLLSSYTEVYEKVVLPLKGLSADTGGVE